MPADETTTTRERLQRAVRSAPDQWRVWWRVALLGVTTIVSYGFVLYSFGVFVVPIEEETGWGTGVVSAAFSLSLLGGGLGAIFAGRVLDKVGARPVMLVSLAAGSVLLLVAASAETAAVFIVAWGLGGGIISAGLFYNVTMAITARLFMDRRAQAFAVLTFVGGLASPIYFPLAGVLVDATGWRDTVRIMVVVLVIGTVPTAMLVRGAAATLANAVEGGPEAGYSSVRQAFRTREVVQMVAMFSLAMSAFSALQVYHVPAMQAAGVSLTAATTIAGVRGFLSLPGRALLSPITTRAGVPRAMLVMYAAMALGVGILILAGSTVFIWDVRRDHRARLRDDCAAARVARRGRVRRAADRDADGCADGRSRGGVGGGAAAGWADGGCDGRLRGGAGHHRDHVRTVAGAARGPAAAF